MTNQAFAPQGRTDLAGRPLDRFDWLVHEATEASEEHGDVRGIKYAILAVAQAIRDASPAWAHDKAVLEDSRGWTR